MSLEFNQSDFAESLRPFLQKVGMSSSVPEAHGLFSGILCGSSAAQKKQKLLWVSLLDLSFDEQDMLAKEAAGVVDDFYQATLAGLSSGNLDFQLAIEEECLLTERLEDFSIWAQGFLYGIGLSHNDNFTNNSEQVQEFMQDLLQISNAEEYELSDEEEEDERALFELMEYVRVGILLVFEELNPIAKKTIDISDIDNSIH